MKKYILKTMLFSMMAAPLFTSCELDQFPETNDVAGREWETTDYAARFNNGLLSTLRSATEGSLGGLMDAQADLFNLGGRSTGYMTAHDWSFNASGFSGDALWERGFTLISNANNILTHIDSVKAQNAQEEFALKDFKANAYFARAYAYTSMAVRYCKNYENAETAKKNLGLPLLEVIDVEARPSRANLYDTYEFIKKDIKQAKTLYAEAMQNPKYKLTTDKPNIFALTALEARMSLDMGDYANALEKSVAVIESGMFDLCYGQDFQALWFVDQGTEIIYQPIQTKEEKIGSFGAFISFDQTEGLFRPDYFPTQGLMDMYEISDIRRQVYFAQTGATAGQGLNDENAVIFTKFPGNENLRKEGEELSFYNMTKVFRLAEMYLIAAEAQYMIDGTQNEYFNYLREVRGASAVEATGEKLFNIIKDEWAREMCGEGFRLNCIKRWGDGIDRKDKMYPQQLVPSFLRGTGYSDLVITPESELYYKIIWEIPSGDMTTNPNLEHNWNN